MPTARHDLTRRDAGEIARSLDAHAYIRQGVRARRRLPPQPAIAALSLCLAGTITHCHVM